MEHVGQVELIGRIELLEVVEHIQQLEPSTTGRVNRNKKR